MTDKNSKSGAPSSDDVAGGPAAPVDTLDSGISPAQAGQSGASQQTDNNADPERARHSIEKVLQKAAKAKVQYSEEEKTNILPYLTEEEQFNDLNFRSENVAGQENQPTFGGMAIGFMGEGEKKK